jgi:GDP-4-dehydro-6-deoxy-D-mannose reductase
VGREDVAEDDPLLRASGVEFLQADISSVEAASQAVNAAQPDRAYLLAAFSAPADAYRDPLGVIQNNVACVVNVLEALREIAPRARVLIVSSSEVYGRGTTSGAPLTEDSPLAPENPYAVSKAAQDLLGYQYHVAYGMDIVRVRPFNHLGPGQSDRFVASAFARQVAERESGLGEQLIEVGNLEAHRDFLDVRDVVAAYELALTLGQPGQVYNLASGRAVAIRSLLDQLIARSQTSFTVSVDPQRFRPADAPILVGDASRFINLTGWSPKVSLDQTLDDLLAYWRERIRLESK